MRCDVSVWVCVVRECAGATDKRPQHGAVAGRPRRRRRHDRHLDSSAPAVTRLRPEITRLRTEAQGQATQGETRRQGIEPL